MLDESTSTKQPHSSSSYHYYMNHNRNSYSSSSSNSNDNYESSHNNSNNNMYDYINHPSQQGQMKLNENLLFGSSPQPWSPLSGQDIPTEIITQSKKINNRYSVSMNESSSNTFPWKNPNKNHNNNSYNNSIDKEYGVIPMYYNRTKSLDPSLIGNDTMNTENT